MDKKRIEDQIKYIEKTIAEMEEKFVKRTDHFALYGLYGRAVGALKGVHDTLENIIEDA